MGNKKRIARAADICSTTEYYAGQRGPAYTVELLAMAIESEAKGKNVRNWMCGEAAMTFVAAAGAFIDAVACRRAEKGET